MVLDENPPFVKVNQIESVKKVLTSAHGGKNSHLKAPHESQQNKNMFFSGILLKQATALSF